MPRYLKTNSTAKAGINYVRDIVESHNCIFQKVDQENDVGIDAFVEVVSNEIPTGNFISFQIKSGSSYFDKKSNECKIPIGNHREYWSKYSLPVYGIVFVPEFNLAYWINIKKYLLTNPNDSIIRFKPSLANLFDKETFNKQFIPLLSGRVPDISFEKSKRLFQSENSDEFYLGLYTLFKKHSNRYEVWDLFVDYFKTHTVDEIPEGLIHYLSVIPWHPDIYFYNDSYTEESRKYGQKLIDLFGEIEVRKLLYFINEENSITRGSLGQSVEAIVSSVPDYDVYLENIIKDKFEHIKIREAAAIIFAYRKGKNGINVLQIITEEESSYIHELIEYVKKFGSYNPYL